MQIYMSVDDWFDHWFSEIFRRTSSFRWCGQWREHPEAMEVLNLLWATWEVAWSVQSPDTKVVWFRDFAYPLVDRITEAKGTFMGCDWSEDPPRHNPVTKKLI